MTTEVSDNPVDFALKTESDIQEIMWNLDIDYKEARDLFFEHSGNPLDAVRAGRRAQAAAEEQARRERIAAEEAARAARQARLDAIEASARGHWARPVRNSLRRVDSSPDFWVISNGLQNGLKRVPSLRDLSLVEIAKASKIGKAEEIEDASQEDSNKVGDGITRETDFQSTIREDAKEKLTSICDMLGSNNLTPSEIVKIRDVLDDVYTYIDKYIIEDDIEDDIEDELGNYSDSENEVEEAGDLSEEDDFSFNEADEEEGEEDIDYDDRVLVHLTQEQFDKLETVSFDTNIDETVGLDGNCAICSDSLKIKKLQCNHLYHLGCAEKWLLHESVQCPTCRHDTRESIKEKVNNDDEM